MYTLYSNRPSSFLFQKLAFISEKNEQKTTDYILLGQQKWKSRWKLGESLSFFFFFFFGWSTPLSSTLNYERLPDIGAGCSVVVSGKKYPSRGSSNHRKKAEKGLFDKSSMISLFLAVDVTHYKGKQLSLYVTEAIQGKQLNHQIALCWQEMQIIFF